MPNDNKTNVRRQLRDQWKRGDDALDSLHRDYAPGEEKHAILQPVDTLKLLLDIYIRELVRIPASLFTFQLFLECGDIRWSLITRYRLELRCIDAEVKVDELGLD